MSDRINLSERVMNLQKSNPFGSYSKVIIHIDDETDVVAGDDLGRTLEITNPFGTQEMAEQMLAKLSGFQYQPYSADGALLDPAAEIGDAISVKDVYGGLYTRVRTFGRLMSANIAAPHDEEINHEYQFEPPVERKLKREIGNVRSTFSILAGEINAKVSRTGGNNVEQSFSWSLTESSHSWYANGESSPVVRINKNGVTIRGNITATTGYIGTSSSGFEITSSAIRKGMESLSDDQHNGVYIGSDGIALGKGRFKVTSSGSVTASSFNMRGGSIIIKDADDNVTFRVGTDGTLTAKSGTFSGNVYAGNIQYGGSSGTFPGAGLSDGSVGSGKTSFQTTLTQVGVNTSDIAGLKRGSFNALACNSLVIGNWQIVIASGGRVYAVEA